MNMKKTTSHRKQDSKNNVLPVPSWVTIECENNTDQQTDVYVMVATHVPGGCLVITQLQADSIGVNSHKAFIPNARITRRRGKNYLIQG